MSGEVEEIMRELDTLTSLELLYLLDNIQEQILTILIQRNELLEDIQEAAH